jgi:hypothetical protein
MAFPRTLIRDVPHFLAETGPGVDVVFRGERKERGQLVPSIFRPGVSLEVSDESTAYLFGDDRKALLETLVAIRAELEAIQWEMDRAVAPDEPPEDPPDDNPFYFGAPGPDVIGNFGVGHGLGDLSMWGPMRRWERLVTVEIIARMQHYGVPTRMLDVTHDPLIALWFATHRMETLSSGLNTYRPSEAPGVVYVMTVPSARRLELFTERGSLAGMLRGVRQQGSLIDGATRDAPDVSHYVTKALVVSPALWTGVRESQERARQFSQDYFFPRPEDDEFFRWLLQAKRGELGTELAAIAQVHDSISTGALKALLSRVIEYDARS